MKGANTIFAQDSQSNAILYTRAVSAQKNRVKMRRTLSHQFLTDLKIEC